MIRTGSHTAHVAIMPAYALSETALKLSRVIEREADRRSALRSSGVTRVEQNISMFRRGSTSVPSSFGGGSTRSMRSIRSRRSVTVAPAPEGAVLDTGTGIVAPIAPPHMIRRALTALAPLPRASVKPSVASDTVVTEPEGPMTFRTRVWEFFDDPQSSPGAYYFSVSLFFFIVLSTVVFIAQTDKSLERHRYTLGVIETVCAGVFTVEYALRTIAAPSKWNFVKNFGNWVDLAAILPFYLEAIMEVENAGSFGAIRIVRLTRVARVLKMSRYSSAIQVFVQAIAISIKALSMLVFLMAIAVVVFSSAIYFAEYTPDGCRTGGWIGQCDGTREAVLASSLGIAAAAGAEGTNQCTCVDPNPYSSIAESFWWSIVTMSTVGYGDMTPVTVPGRIVGIATILTGMLVLALPITVIGTNFQKVMKSVMQQTMKSNVDYLKGKKQICREEIQAILQRFHAVTTDIHLNIDDIIQVYDTDNSGSLEDGELARFRHDLEMLQNRALMNQHMDIQGTPTASVTIAAPLAVRPLPTNRKTISVRRSSLSHPSKVTPKATGKSLGSSEDRSTACHPLGADSDGATEVTAAGPSIEELMSDDQPTVSVVSPYKTSHPQGFMGYADESDFVEGMMDGPHDHHKVSPTASHRLQHHQHVSTDDLILQRLAEIQRTFEDRLVETEARLESKILNLTKILMRVEQLIELDD